MQNRKIGLFIAIGSCGLCFILVIILMFAFIINIGESSSYSSISSSTIGDRVDVLKIEGIIGESEDSLFSTSSYNHTFIIDSLNALIDDTSSKGLILFIDSPGGSVYHTDEIYLKLLEYKNTGRPIYASFGSTAASGGYYIACAADKIICNRNTITGSIGVIMQNVMDMSGLYEKLGIKIETITAGKNKAMGNGTEPLTDEQREILQSMLDETHNQFIEVVATGRHLSFEEASKLADGRIYTAKQALANGLVDEIGNFDDTLSIIGESEGLEGLPLNYLTPNTPSFLDSLLLKVSNLTPKSELSTLIQFEEGISKFGYYCELPFKY